MADEFEFQASEIILSDLSVLSTEQSVLQEARICDLAELATDAAHFSLKLISDGMSICDIFAIICGEITFGENIVHTEALIENLQRLHEHFKFLILQDKAVFSQLYIEKMRALGVYISESDLLPVGDAQESFVYVKNAFADEAYDVFSQAFSDPRVRYAVSLKEALTAVFDGEATYCLLPLEEKGMRLSTVAEMIYRADLKIVSVTPVFGFDGSADMKYALVAKRFTAAQYSPDDDRYFEIRLPSDSLVSLSEVLFAAEAYGVGCYRVNTDIRQEEAGEESSYSIVFKSDGGGFVSLLVYLTLFAPDYTPVGMYKNLE